MIGNKKRANLEILKTKNEVLVKKIDPLQKLWYELKVIKRFNGDYKKFLDEYGNIQKSEFLFNLAKNNNLCDSFKNLDDFNVEYYRQQSALKDAYEIYNKFKYLEFNAFYDSIMTNESFTKKNYELFVLKGYSGSSADFIELIREERKHDKSLRYSSINEIETKIETNKTEQERIKSSIFYSSSGNLIEYLLWILGIIYGLRIIIFILRWSIQKVKN